METALPGGVLRTPLRRTKRRKRNKETKTIQRTAGTVTNGFLNQHFSPLWFKEDTIADAANVQACFFHSLTNLCISYKISPPDVAGLVFPQNVYTAFTQVKAAMEKVAPNLQLLIVEENEILPACIATAEVFDTKQTLYYFPLRPAWTFFQRNRGTTEAALLTSVLAYMYQVLCVPPCVGSSYIGSTYGLIKETEQENEESYTRQEHSRTMAAINEVERYGQRMMNWLSNMKEVAMLPSRLQRFKPKTDTGRVLQAIATKVCALAADYNQPFFAGCEHELLHPQQESRAYPDDYVSFTWNDSGWIAEYVDEYVNGDLGERDTTEEPLHVVLFDKVQSIEPFPFEFENKVFDLFTDVANYLYNLI